MFFGGIWCHLYCVHIVCIVYIVYIFFSLLLILISAPRRKIIVFFGETDAFHLFWQVGWVTDATKNLSKCTKEQKGRLNFCRIVLFTERHGMRVVCWWLLSFYCCCTILHYLLAELWNTLLLIKELIVCLSHEQKTMIRKTDNIGLFVQMASYFLSFLPSISKQVSVNQNQKLNYWQRPN